MGNPIKEVQISVILEPAESGRRLATGSRSGQSPLLFKNIIRTKISKIKPTN